MPTCTTRITAISRLHYFVTERILLSLDTGIRFLIGFSVGMFSAMMKDTCMKSLFILLDLTFPVHTVMPTAGSLMGIHYVYFHIII